MANEKVFQSRIQLKHDIEENWLKATNFIPKEGEIVIYDVDANNPIARFKIGDGVTKVNQLSFVSHHKIISYLPQVLSEEEKAQARENIGAASLEELNNLEYSWDDLNDKPFGDIVPISSYTIFSDTFSGPGTTCITTNCNKFIEDYIREDEGLNRLEVTYDGTAYQVAVWPGLSPSYFCGVGNYKLDTIHSGGALGPNIDLPFCIVQRQSSLGDFYVSASTEGEHTISLKVIDRSYTKLDEKFISSEIARDKEVVEYVDTNVAELVDDAPETLNTLNKLATALGDDPDFSTTVYGQIDTKVAKEDGKGLSTNDFTDEYKNKVDDVSNALDTKMDTANPTGTGSFSLNRKADTTVGDYSVAIGSNTTASGNYSHAEGQNTTASGNYSHAEGQYTTASGAYSHAEGGQSNTASGAYSHAEGGGTSATGDCSHVEGGNGSEASGAYSHAEGRMSRAAGNSSHAEGFGTKAVSEYQHTQGKANIPDSENIYAHIVGNGTITDFGGGVILPSKNSNAHTLDWDGNAWFAGDVYVGSTSGTNKDEGSKKLVTEDEVTDALAESKADWNQNDETTPDYVKNRTHYEISRKNEVLVDNVTVDSFAKDGDNDWYVSAENPFDVNITAMDEYTVIFDGVEYECVGERYQNYKYKDDGTISSYFDWDCIGNVEPIHQNSQWTNTSLPFCIAKDYYRNSGEIQVFVYNDTSASHTISIINKTPTVQKIHLKYMPEEMPIIRKGSGIGSVVFGYPYNSNIASGSYSYAEGGYTIASGQASHAEGATTIASGNNSHAEGRSTTASGKNSHAEGYITNASGHYSHAEGAQTATSNYYSHAEGNGSIASGMTSHAQNYFTTASGKNSHAEGRFTIANSSMQHVQGEYNIADIPDSDRGDRGQYLHIVGNGTAEDARSNAHALDWEGNAWFAGDVYVGSTSGTNKDEGAKKLVTEDNITTVTVKTWTSADMV